MQCVAQDSEEHERERETYARSTVGATGLGEEREHHLAFVARHLGLAQTLRHELAMFPGLHSDQACRRSVGEKRENDTGYLDDVNGAYEFGGCVLSAQNAADDYSQHDRTGDSQGSANQRDDRHVYKAWVVLSPQRPCSRDDDAIGDNELASH